MPEDGRWQRRLNQVLLATARAGSSSEDGGGGRSRTPLQPSVFDGAWTLPEAPACSCSTHLWRSPPKSPSEPSTRRPCGSCSVRPERMAWATTTAPADLGRRLPRGQHRGASGRRRRRLRFGRRTTVGVRLQQLLLRSCSFQTTARTRESSSGQRAAAYSAERSIWREPLHGESDPILLQGKGRRPLAASAADSLRPCSTDPPSPPSPSTVSDIAATVLPLSRAPAAPSSSSSPSNPSLSHQMEGNATSLHQSASSVEAAPVRFAEVSARAEALRRARPPASSEADGDLRSPATATTEAREGRPLDHLHSPVTAIPERGCSLHARRQRLFVRRRRSSRSAGASSPRRRRQASNRVRSTHPLPRSSSLDLHGLRMADNNRASQFQPNGDASRQGNQGVPPPIWTPQYWHAHPFDPNSPSTMNLANDPMSTPIWRQPHMEPSTFGLNNPWNNYFRMMSPPSQGPQISFGNGQMQPPSPFTHVNSNATNPSGPINVESEAEHSVDEVNSPTKPTDTLETVRRGKEQNFKPEEDLLLCKTWLQISCDPVISTGQRKEGLWSRIEKRYNQVRGQFPMRVNRALSSRWDKIRAETGKYSGLYARVVRENQSGLTDDDKLAKAATLYATEHNKSFGFMHCWNALKAEPKWQAIVQGSNYRGTAGMAPVGSGTPSANVNDFESDSAGLTGKRPMGRDSTKASRKKAMSSSSQSTDYLSRIHEIQMARLKQSEDKSEKKQENIEFLKDVELKNLEVRTKEIEMQQAKFRFEDRLQKNAELKELLAMDMDQLPEDVRPAYLAKRKGLVEFFVNNPV